MVGIAFDMADELDAVNWFIGIVCGRLNWNLVLLAAMCVLWILYVGVLALQSGS